VLNFAHTDVAFFSSFRFPDKTSCIADGALSAKIAEELAYENEAEIESEPDFLKEFKNSGIWKVCLGLFCFTLDHRH
jgi:complement component 1 Q subcomponent-binding protein